MRKLKEGQKSKAICSKCSEIVRTTYKTKKSVKIDKNVFIKNSLVGVCDKCSTVVSIPMQSFKK